MTCDHKWGKWRDVPRNQLPLIGCMFIHVERVRRCDDCGRAEYRTGVVTLRPQPRSS